MTAVLVNDAEWEILAGEPAELLKLYVALKRRMDFATGIAGQKTLINEIVLREGFVVDPIPGRAKPKPYTREQGRSAVRRLERLGAIKVIGPLVFEFPHARRDQSDQKSYNQATTKLQPEQQPPKNQADPNEYGGSSDSKGQAATGLFLEQVPSSNLLPVSGNNRTVPNACVRERPADPATAGQWCQFFIRERGFQIHTVQTARTMPLFASWVERGVTAEQMLAAMEIAEAKLGAPPDSPLYYRNFLDELLLERHRMATAPHAEHRHEQTDGRNAEGQAGHRAAKRGLSHRQGPRSAVDRVNAIVAANEAARQAAGTALGEDDRDVRAPLDVEFWRQPEP
ncbi:hypothetical protein [Pseudomonas aeruginosa]|nr:hypothetical protein [Pseudomonas aeruginosa]HCR1292458.1 hypothetical protein [Pseudomonas aeruginosa]